MQPPESTPDLPPQQCGLDANAAGRAQLIDKLAQLVVRQRRRMQHQQSPPWTCPPKTQGSNEPAGL